MGTELHSDRAAHVRVEIHHPKFDDPVDGGGGDEIGPSRPLDCVDTRYLLLVV